MSKPRRLKRMADEDQEKGTGSDTDIEMSSSSSSVSLSPRVRGRARRVISESDTESELEPGSAVTVSRSRSPSPPPPSPQFKSRHKPTAKERAEQKRREAKERQVKVASVEPEPAFEIQTVVKGDVVEIIDMKGEIWKGTVVLAGPTLINLDLGQKRTHLVLRKDISDLRLISRAPIPGRVLVKPKRTKVKQPKPKSPPKPQPLPAPVPPVKTPVELEIEREERLVKGLRQGRLQAMLETGATELEIEREERLRQGRLQAMLELEREEQERKRAAELALKKATEAAIEEYERQQQEAERLRLNELQRRQEEKEQARLEAERRQRLLEKEEEDKASQRLFQEPPVDISDVKKEVGLQATSDEIYAAFKACRQDWGRSFPTLTIDDLLKPVKDSDVFQIAVERHGKVYSLAGRDLIHVKDFIPMVWNPPTIITVRGKQGKPDRQQSRRGFDSRPKFRNQVGYMYYMNDENIRRLSQFVGCVRKMNEQFGKHAVVEGKAPLDKKYGIIGWDVPFVMPDWVAKILRDKTPRDARLNPILEERGTIRFSKCSLNHLTLNAALAYLRKHDDVFRQNLFEELVRNGYTMSNYLASPTVVAVAGWAHHARYFWKNADSKQILVYDPWKQSMSDKSEAWKEIAAAMAVRGYSHRFVTKSVDQSAGEGSCLIVALTRALMLARLGPASLEQQMLPEYAVLASRLVSKFRQVRR